MQEINFYKYHAAGNDFIFIAESTAMLLKQKKLFYDLCQKICHRHFGIGADGLIYLEQKKQELTMHYYNSDGTSANMCGNGMRAFRQYLDDVYHVTTTPLEIKTTCGKTIVEYPESNKIAVLLDTIPQIIPITTTDLQAYYTYTMTDHVVIEVTEIPEDFMTLGATIEKDPQFPNGTNVNFVKRKNDNLLEVVTWERGAGATLACGTGVCAAAHVMKNIHQLKQTLFNILTKGGSLQVKIDAAGIQLIGHATAIAKGTYFYHEGMEEK